MKNTPQNIAKEIKEAAAKGGWIISTHGSILTIQKKFTPGSNEEFVECDMSYYDILSLAPRTQPGSDWGTDGSGIGAISAIKNGVFVMNRSGVSKRVLNALKSL